MKERFQLALEKLASEPERKHQALRLWLRLLTTSDLVKKHLRARLRERFDTTLPRFDVMAALARVPEGQTMGELSRWLLVSSGNVTGIIRRLEKEGLVLRTREKSDRRRHLVRLSEAGMRAFELHSREHEKWIREIFSGLTPEEMATLQRLLKKAKEYLAAQPDTS